MSGIEFRALRANEIECRVGTIGRKKQTNELYCTLLLYKDARSDMNILDEVIGAENWQRKHYEVKGNLFCSVGINFGEGFVYKDDCGSESYTEKEKGEASDSFKRACVNWGIGRELYTAPFIYIQLTEDEVYEKNNKLALGNKVKFNVAHIGYGDNGTKRYISELLIKDKKGNDRYKYGKFESEHASDDFNGIVNGEKTNDHTCSDCGRPLNQMSNDDFNALVNDEEKKDDVYICAECGAQIVGTNTITAKTIAGGTLKSFGRILCQRCGVKEKKARAEAEKNAG